MRMFRTPFIYLLIYDIKHDSWSADEGWYSSATLNHWLPCFPGIRRNLRPAAHLLLTARGTSSIHGAYISSLTTWHCHPNSIVIKGIYQRARSFLTIYPTSPHPQFSQHQLQHSTRETYVSSWNAQTVMPNSKHRSRSEGGRLSFEIVGCQE